MDILVSTFPYHLKKLNCMVRFLTCTKVELWLISSIFSLIKKDHKTNTKIVISEEKMLFWGEDGWIYIYEEEKFLFKFFEILKPQNMNYIQ